MKEIYEDGNFESMSNVDKILASVAREYSENIMKPYEVKKKEENGDV